MKSTHLVELRKFELVDESSQEIIFGLNQEWYKTKWQKMAGCGPTAASSLIYYRLSNNKTLNKDAAIQLMDVLWDYVTPGMGGVYKRSMFTDGLKRYFDTHQINATIDSIEITKNKKTRKSLKETIDFIETGLSLNSPIAFLNLDNGDEEKLDEWHWVVVSGIDIHEDHEQVFIHIIDDGKLFAIDLDLWLRTTKKGGAFVYFTLI
jgi:hypothetical protein